MNFRSIKTLYIENGKISNKTEKSETIRKGSIFHLEYATDSEEEGTFGVFCVYKEHRIWFCSIESIIRSEYFEVIVDEY